MAELIAENSPTVIVALVVIGAVLHLFAWTELDKLHWVDIFMRGLPFEDLSPRGQLLEIGAWVFAVAAVVVIVATYVLPRLPLGGP